MANQYQKMPVPSVSGSAPDTGTVGAEERSTNVKEGAPEMPAGEFTITPEHEDTSDIPATITSKNGERASGGQPAGRAAAAPIDCCP